MTSIPIEPATRPTALITGASAGIGRDFAHLFAEHQHNLVLCARDKDRLTAIASQLHEKYGVNAYVMPADLADPAAVLALFEETEKRSIRIDVLVNNAGFGTHGPFSQTDKSAELAMIQVNIAALTHLTRLFLPQMLSRRQGKILNVGSMAGFIPGPYMSTY